MIWDVGSNPLWSCAKFSWVRSDSLVSCAQVYSWVQNYQSTMEESSGDHTVQGPAQTRWWLLRVVSCWVLTPSTMENPQALRNFSIDNIDTKTGLQVFSTSKWNFLYFNLCSLPLVLSLDATEQRLSLSLLISSEIGWLYIIETYTGRFFSGLNILSL